MSGEKVEIDEKDREKIVISLRVNKSFWEQGVCRLADFEGITRSDWMERAGLHFIQKIWESIKSSGLAEEREVKKVE